MIHRLSALVGDYFKEKEAARSELAQKIACVSSAGVRPLAWTQLDDTLVGDGSNILDRNDPFNTLTRPQSMAIDERLI